jgi:hypothetical protein
MKYDLKETSVTFEVTMELREFNQILETLRPLKSLNGGRSFDIFPNTSIAAFVALLEDITEDLS